MVMPTFMRSWISGKVNKYRDFPNPELGAGDGVNPTDNMRLDGIDGHTYAKEDGAYGRGQLLRKSANLAERGLGRYIPRREP